jgi:hypothetical protein
MLARLWRFLRTFRRWQAPAPRMTTMCAWCHRVLHWGGFTVTHTICADCARREFPQT